MAKTCWHGNHSVYSQWNEFICDMLELLSLHRRIAHAYSVFLKYQVATVIKWLVWVSWKSSMGFGPSRPKVSVFSLPFEIVSYSVLYSRCWHPHIHTVLPNFSQYESEFHDVKDKNQSSREKNCCSKQNLCFNQHLLHLLWFTFHYCKVQSSITEKENDCFSVAKSTAEKCPSLSLPISWHQRNKAKRIRRLKETHTNFPFFPSGKNNSV